MSDTTYQERIKHLFDEEGFADAADLYVAAQNDLRKAREFYRKANEFFSEAEKTYQEAYDTTLEYQKLRREVKEFYALTWLVFVTMILLIVFVNLFV